MPSPTNLNLDQTAERARLLKDWTRRQGDDLPYTVEFWRDGAQVAMWRPEHQPHAEIGREHANLGHTAAEHGAVAAAIVGFGADALAVVEEVFLLDLTTAGWFVPPSGDVADHPGAVAAVTAMVFHRGPEADRQVAMPYSVDIDADAIGWGQPLWGDPAELGSEALAEPVRGAFGAATLVERVRGMEQAAADLATWRYLSERGTLLSPLGAPMPSAGAVCAVTVSALVAVLAAYAETRA
ncbi:MAG: hypothetical protein ACKVWR_08315 [Acidimicrobiales bacterium]